MARGVGSGRHGRFPLVSCAKGGSPMWKHLWQIGALACAMAVMGAPAGAVPQ